MSTQRHIAANASPAPTTTSNFVPKLPLQRDFGTKVRPILGVCRRCPRWPPLPKVLAPRHLRRIESPARCLAPRSQTADFRSTSPLECGDSSPLLVQRTSFHKLQGRDVGRTAASIPTVKSRRIPPDQRIVESLGRRFGLAWLGSSFRRTRNGRFKRLPIAPQGTFTTRSKSISPATRTIRQNFTVTLLRESDFPSHKVWLDGSRVIYVQKGPFVSLWRSEPKMGATCVTKDGTVRSRLQPILGLRLGILTRNGSRE